MSETETLAPAVATTEIDNIIREMEGVMVLTVEQLEETVQNMSDRGLSYPQITGPLSDRVRTRTYVSGEHFVDALLDIRNLLAPPQEDENETETTEVASNEPTEETESTEPTNAG